MIHFLNSLCKFLRVQVSFLMISPLCDPHPTFRPGDPQSAQDKARMDKEYLSLMAELGEAPVPASVGSASGPASTPLASAPRPAAPANNPPPPVSFSRLFSWPGPLSSSEEGVMARDFGQNRLDMAGNIVLSGCQMSCPCVLVLWHS